jgi:hypothetical protein
MEVLGVVTARKLNEICAGINAVKKNYQIFCTRDGAFNFQVCTIFNGTENDV